MTIARTIHEEIHVDISASQREKLKELEFDETKLGIWIDPIGMYMYMYTYVYCVYIVLYYYSIHCTCTHVYSGTIVDTIGTT